MGELVSYPVDGDSSEGYLALPSSTGPGVLVIQEWWGLVSHIVSLADRFAEAGFVAFAPDLYHGVQTTERDEARRLAKGLPMQRAAQDLTGAAAYLASHPKVSGDLGAVGFSMGGSLALWTATLADQVTTAVGFYPALAWERMRPRWERYAGKVAVIHCAEADGTSTAPGIQSARTAIEAAGGTCTLLDYPGTRHSFFNDDQPDAFDADAAVSAWARTLDTLRSRLA